MISFISSLEIIDVVLPDPNMFLWIAASIADAAAVNPNRIKTILANRLTTFPIKAIQFLVMVLKVCLEILLIFLFYVIEFLISFISWRIICKRFWKFCVLVNNTLCGKLFSSWDLTTAIDERFTSYFRNIFHSRFEFIKLRIRKFYVYSIILNLFILILY